MKVFTMEEKVRGNEDRIRNQTKIVQQSQSLSRKLISPLLVAVRHFGIKDATVRNGFLGKTSGWLKVGHVPSHCHEWNLLHMLVQRRTGMKMGGYSVTTYLSRGSALIDDRY